MVKGDVGNRSVPLLGVWSALKRTNKTIGFVILQSPVGIGNWYLNTLEFGAYTGYPKKCIHLTFDSSIDVYFQI